MNVCTHNSHAPSTEELNMPRIESRLHARVYFYHCSECKDLAVDARDAYDELNDVTVILERPYYITHHNDTVK